MQFTSPQSFPPQEDSPTQKESKQLFPIDETEEFHDPFSDLNLFLVRSIKEELRREKNPKQWSHKIASLLFKEILPEFTKRFPAYRLGQNALKKTWEKVRYYLDRFEQEKKALYPNGKLNIEYLIKKNLSNWRGKNAFSATHSYQKASQLALKISECIALINGERPSFEKLQATLWSMIKHLLPKQQSLQETYDPLDRMIVRMQLEELAKNPILSNCSLKEAIKNHFHTLSLSSFFASIRIDHPEWSVAEVEKESVKHLHYAQNIDTSSLEEKIDFWSLQHDMVAAVISFDEKTPFLDIVEQIAPKEKKLSLKEIEEQATEKILTLHPSLSPWKNGIKERVAILYKYLWYTSYRKENESSYDRFLQWHEGIPLSLLEKMLPLMPVD